MENNITFKKAFFGGFEREGVMNYIAEITDEFQKYKKETVLKVEEMKSKLSQLENAYNNILEENEKLKHDISKSVTESSDEDKFNIRELVGGLTESMNVLLSFISSEETQTEESISSDEENECNEQMSKENEDFSKGESTSEESENEDLSDATETNDNQQNIDDIINKYI